MKNTIATKAIFRHEGEFCVCALVQGTCTWDLGGHLVPCPITQSPYSLKTGSLTVVV